MRVAEVDLAAEIEDLLLGGGELARRLGVGAGFGDGLADLELAAEVVRGGLVALEVQLAGGLERVDVVLERVGQGVVEDGSDPAVDGQFEGLTASLAPSALSSQVAATTAVRRTRAFSSRIA